MRGHLTRGVIKKDAYDFLRDVPVDQPGSKRPLGTAMATIRDRDYLLDRAG
jgi:hypothetical protein